jgi:H+/Cl- antiporter ClcA
LLKIIFTSITLNFGGSGGVITPIFFIGATAGVVFANLTGMDRATFAAIGLVSVLSGATNTPIASSIMAIELFGTGIVHYAALSCIISFLMTGHRSIYPSQIIGMKKSSSIEVEIGKEADEVNPRFQQKKISFVEQIFSVSDSLIEKIKKGKRQN